MDDRSMALREAIDRARQKGPRWRCPGQVRAEAVAYTLEQRSAGETMAEVSRRLGIAESSLTRWVRQEADRSAPAFRKVSVSRRQTGAGLVLVTPRGYRVEGLSVAATVELLSQL